MIYISKGIAGRDSTAELVHVLRGSQDIYLSNKEAELWLRGRFAFAVSKTSEEDFILQHLIRMGLAEAETEECRDSQYWILMRCICCPAKAARKTLGLSGEEKAILFWLINAGIRLSTAELIYLMEHHIEPISGLLHKENRQALIETLYTSDTIADNILENHMTAAECRDNVIHSLLSLLNKRKILML